MRHSWRLAWVAVMMTAIGCADAGAPPEEEESVAQSEEALSDALHAQASGRTVLADVVAIDQMFVYDRYGAFNPAGMVYALRRDVVAADPSRPVGPGNATLRPGKRPRPLVLRVNAGDRLSISFTNWLAPADGPLPNASPSTRHASIHVVGLQIRNLDALGGDVGQNESSLAAPGETRRYELFAGREGTFLMHSAGAMMGADGIGRPLRQIAQGLFGAVHVEPVGAVAYRSQVTAEELKAASLDPPNPDGTPRINYRAVDASGVPILRMIDDEGHIVHGDLNAIIADYDETEVGTPASKDVGYFREFTVLFHDELGAVQAFPELQRDPHYHGVRSGFGINYGAASLGAAVLANRRKIGPSKDCVECKFEEFFLSSWTSGDPALNIERDEDDNAVRALYPDDPSNVSHGYLGDPVRIRNLHAGPSETHVFHVHGHQWLRSPSNENSTYVDSQTIGPRAAYTYDIAYGGGGNRNLTAGDSIYHCHLYPHFVQGMWGLWRNHDVFEAGTPDRALPDGELAGGTPTPAVVPIPRAALPPMPTDAPTTVALPDGRTAVRPAMRGYPFYIAALAGHRASQPPRDMEHDGGLPRHVITSVPPGGAELGARGDFDVQIHEANVKLLPKKGTAAEVAAMDFHAGAFPGAVPVTTRYGFPAKGYPSFTAEGERALFLVNGQPPVAGAPYADPCPPDAPVRTYRAAYVQVDAPVNGAGWHNPQARAIVLERDVEATLAGTRPLEPLFIRARSGECVVFHATNLIPDRLAQDDFQIDTPTDVIGQHIHLVKFDVTSSDGAANGFNYEDGTLAAQEVVARIDAANALGGALKADGAVVESGARVRLAARQHPYLPGAPLGTQTTTQRWWADPIASAAGEGRALSTAFTHDHFSASSHQHHGLYAGLVVEPAGSLWRDPETGETFGGRSDGGPTSYRADILFPDGDGRAPFREFNLSLADYAIAYDECGNPVNPPTQTAAALPAAVTHQGFAPEPLSWRDPGAGVVNYRNEPIPMRIAERSCATGEVAQKAGAAGDMHNVFSSIVHGDPATPLLRAYEGDRALIRLTQGAQAEQHVFSVHGKKWLKETDDPDSGFSNGQPIGASEQMDLALDATPLFVKNAAGGADYLYQSAASDDLWKGMWGLLRVHGAPVPGLLPLPGASPPDVPAEHARVCPPDARVRSYVVHAIAAKGNLPGDRLTYDAAHGLYDPDAILFVLAGDLAAVRSGARPAEPLVLRAAAGECVEVTLVNELPESPPKTPHWNYNTPIVDGFNVNQVRSSNRVSLHPQLVAYDVATSDGANVGRNGDQTVGPGERRKYTWYAGNVTAAPGGGVRWTPVELGAINLKDMADVVNHPMHGAIGALIVEPEGAVWYPNRDTRAAVQVKYRDPSGAEIWFREIVLFYQDEVALHSDDAAFHCTTASLDCGTALRNLVGDVDSDTSGHQAFNYRTTPLWARLGVPPETRIGGLAGLDLSDAFSSAERGDPATPVFKMSVYDRVRVRVLQPSGHRRQHSFSLWGTEWAHNPWAEGAGSRTMGRNRKSFAVGAQGGIGPMSAWNIVPYFRVGGMFAVPGDRLYLDQLNPMLAGGLWGIVRLTP
ncbi:copper oxidase [Sorangium sp. So ce131]|uniref:copper oxidase n=1 Tax=Sorangium sp. So ce131 TaxID=3133282 RepID=UPI003F62AC1D